MTKGEPTTDEVPAEVAEYLLRSITTLSPNYGVEVFRLGPRKEASPPDAGEKP
jgi:hypothetical protein